MLVIREEGGMSTLSGKAVQVLRGLSRSQRRAGEQQDDGVHPAEWWKERQVTPAVSKTHSRV